jgi:hypothetical protein
MLLSLDRFHLLPLFPQSNAYQLEADADRGEWPLLGTVVTRAIA